MPTHHKPSTNTPGNQKNAATTPKPSTKMDKDAPASVKAGEHSKTTGSGMGASESAGKDRNMKTHK